MKLSCDYLTGQFFVYSLWLQYPLTLECSVFDYNDDTGILVGNIESMVADERVLTDGKVDYDKLKPIIFDCSTNTYRVIGPVVGKAFNDGKTIK